MTPDPKVTGAKSIPAELYHTSFEFIKENLWAKKKGAL